jgi:hypothetical protein
MYHQYVSPVCITSMYDIQSHALHGAHATTNDRDARPRPGPTYPPIPTYWVLPYLLTLTCSAFDQRPLAWPGTPTLVVVSNSSWLIASCRPTCPPPPPPPAATPSRSVSATRAPLRFFVLARSASSRVRLRAATFGEGKQRWSVGWGCIRTMVHSSSTGTQQPVAGGMAAVG